ncbi:hypothetical protein [Zooshikella sp. RANM57]|uniref:hypothetical protein n=1 Tax=Zooshikella sp. RANM57 TaxID=3425863 RepID=UPI003D6EBF5D
MKILLILLTAILSTTCFGKGEALDKVKIYYIPIGVATYGAMTPNNIEELATHLGMTNLSDPRFKKLMRILKSSSSGQFEGNKLRVKIILPKNDIIYVDNYGGIKLSESKTLKLDNSNLQTVKAILNGITTPK